MLQRLRRARPVVGLDRTLKAKMIEAILADYLGGPLAGKRLLDIGCGNGGISAYFARNNEVAAVDVSDRRDADKRELFEFRQVDSEALPFPEARFDIVLSHHVIEHVEDQSRHLREIRRVLTLNGVCYLATPNRSSPIMKGHVGNNQVLRYGQMAALFRANGFEPTEYGLQVFCEPRKYYGEISVGRFVPRFVAKPLRPLFPSHMFVLRPTRGR